LKVVPLHAANPGAMTGAGNWTYLIPGAEPVLIDAGVGELAHLNAVGEANSGIGPTRVIVTHAHRDHASGAAALGERWPRAAFAKWPWPEQDARYAVTWERLTDGERVAAGDDELVVVHTPGHAPDHIALWHEPSRTVFSGDLVVLGSTVVIPASAGGDLVDYLHSLQRILALDPGRLLPAHGPAIDNPGQVIHQYLDHRHQREVQVIGALEAGIEDLDGITARIYRGLDQALTAMARESVLAHLQKLEEDGLARRTGSGWAMVT
jgi:glyoxylase-like metal-dependent hydrolase (beta-lactamase superfamily II)